MRPPAARMWCSGSPTTVLPKEHKAGIAYGTEIHFTFRSDLIHLFDPEMEKNLLPLEVSQ